jgi:hypothetical protein
MSWIDAKIIEGATKVAGFEKGSRSSEVHLLQTLVQGLTADAQSHGCN